ESPAVVVGTNRDGLQSQASSSGMCPNMAQQRRQCAQSAQVLPSGRSMSSPLRRIGMRSVIGVLLAPVSAPVNLGNFKIIRADLLPAPPRFPAEQAEQRGQA